MKSHTLLYLWLMAVCLMVGCAKGTEPVEEDSVKLLGSREILLGADGGKVEISFESSGAWKVSVDAASASLCTVHNSSGAAGTVVTGLTVYQNGSYDPRTILVTIACGNASETVAIIQAQMDAIIIAKDTYEVDYGEGRIELNVNANVDFTVESGADWISPEIQKSSKALENRLLVLKVEENTSFVPREGTVLLKYGELEQKIKIVQAAGVFDPEQLTGRMQIAIVHSETVFPPLLFEGDDITGVVFWGDGTQSLWDEGHTFGTEGEKETVFEISGADSFRIEALHSISSITIGL